MKKNSLKLLVLSRFDASGAGPRYRVYQYFDHFREMGLEIVEKPLFDIEYIDNIFKKNKRSFSLILKKYFQRALFLLFNKSRFDMVLMDGELFPFVPFFLEKLFLPKTYIMDQDDAIFHTYDLNRSFLVRALFKNKIDQTMKNSCHVVVGNSYVMERALSVGAPKVTAIPTVIDADKYKPSSKPAANKKIVIGWVGSPPTVSYLSLIEPALKNLAKKEDFVLYVIGAKYSLDGVNVLYNDWPDGWSEEKEIELTNNIDIGIMPLCDGLWEKGKCGLKLIKYMGCAKPMVASNIGMNPEIIDHGLNGYLASSLEDWENYLSILIRDAEKREQFGKHGREKMLKQFSLEVAAPVFCDILKQNIAGLRPQLSDSVV